MQMKIRPDSITIKATNNDTKEVKTYTLTKDNNWTMFTDIKKDDHDKWSFKEDVPEGYESKDPVWDGVNYVITFTNHHDNPGIVDLNIQKAWDDSDNGDDMRPTSITATLYKNGEKTDQSVTLNSSNNWSDTSTFHGLEKYDQAGEEINYEIKEEVLII